MTCRTYREFEQKIRNCDTNLEIVRLCVDNYFFAKEFIAKEDWIKLMCYEHKFMGGTK